MSLQTRLFAHLRHRLGHHTIPLLHRNTRTMGSSSVVLLLPNTRMVVTLRRLRRHFESIDNVAESVNCKNEKK
jgi:hypothetical protein